MVAVTRSFQVATKGALAEVHKILVSTAKREHAEVMGTEPRPRRFTRIVDGSIGAPEEQVKPTGVITYLYPRIDEVAQYALEVLFDLSPVRSGTYRKSHALFLNGRQVNDLKHYETGDEVIIANFVPYARKIELGLMTMRVSGSDQVYTRAVKRVRSRFGNVADVKMTYRGIISGVAVKGRAGNKAGLRYPALLIAGH